LLDGGTPCDRFAYFSKFLRVYAHLSKEREVLERLEHRTEQSVSDADLSVYAIIKGYGKGVTGFCLYAGDFLHNVTPKDRS